MQRYPDIFHLSGTTSLLVRQSVFRPAVEEEVEEEEVVEVVVVEMAVVMLVVQYSGPARRSAAATTKILSYRSHRR